MNHQNQNEKRALPPAFLFIGLIFLLLVALVMNVNTGSVSIGVYDIFRIIFLGAEEGSTAYNIIWRIRLPRLLAAAVMGGALSVSGYLLQAFFRNPIAGPFVLGISSGAKLFVGATMITVLSAGAQMPLWMMVAASFLGSMVSTGVVLICAGRLKGMSMLLVVGMMIGYICSAITDFFITFAQEAEVANLTYWSMGSFSGMNWDNLGIATLVIGVAMLAVFLLSKPIGAYALGEGYAQSMGINVSVFRVFLIGLSSLLSAAVTAFAGPVSFVGIAVPHIAKMLFRTAQPRIIIPGTFLAGAVFCMFCDLLARTVFAPVELAIGTVTAVFGAPVVIYLMLTKKRGGE